MANFNFYLTTNQCKEQANDVLRGSYKQSAGMTAIFLVIMLCLVALTTLLSIFVAWWISIPLGLLSLLAFAILLYGYNAYCLNLANEKSVKTLDLFAGFGRNLGKIIKVSIKKFFLSIFWLVMLIVPYLVKSIGYSMSTLMLIDNKKYNAQNVLKESKHVMKQNYGRYVKFQLSFFWWFLLCVASGGIALLWVFPKYSTSKAVFYENLKTDF